jgi:putative PIN family toxin of toxin-antitoxin system
MILDMRVVLDTPVLVAGLRSQLGASNKVLLAVAEQRCTPLVTTAVFLEYESALLRPEHRLATGMDPADVEEFLAALASAAEAVELNFLWRPQLRDPADEFMLEAAVNGQAAALVTHNVDDFQSVTARFGIRTLTPGAFLKELAT